MANLPRVILASSTEAVPVMEAVNIKLEGSARVKQWDNLFSLSSMTLPTLEEATKEFDFAVFVFHKDDQSIIRGKIYDVVRDNVVFELGMFIGALGREKCFVLVPKTVGTFRLPSDLSGLTIAQYDDEIEDPVDAVTTCCAKIKRALKPPASAVVRSKSPAAVTPLKVAETAIQNLQSEIFKARFDIERARETVAFHESAILQQFQVLAKPATPREIAAWEEGAKKVYDKPVKIRSSNAYYIDRPCIVPAQHGAHAFSLIVAAGVPIFGLDRFSHNTIYYMDGFRHTGY